MDNGQAHLAQQDGASSSRAAGLGQPSGLLARHDTTHSLPDNRAARSRRRDWSHPPSRNVPRMPPMPSNARNVHTVMVMIWALGRLSSYTAPIPAGDMNTALSAPIAISQVTLMGTKHTITSGPIRRGNQDHATCRTSKISEEKTHFETCKKMTKKSST